MGNIKLDEIKEKAKMLGERFNGINNWIMTNPNTDPNCFELTDCLMEYGNLVSSYKGFLISEGRFEDDFDVVNSFRRQVEEFNGVSSSMSKMLQLRGVIALGKNQELEGFPIIEGDNGARYVDSNYFLENTDALRSLRNIYYDVAEGTFSGANFLGEELFSEKKDVLCKIAGVHLYCWQVRSRENPNYEFDNVGEMELMKRLPDLKEKLINKGDYYLISDHSCENMFDNISSIYKYNTSQTTK